MTKPITRLLSVDVFRAVTMFFMIFVNELSGSEGIPGWIDHVDSEVDGMGFADTIFPAFLFIVGLSIPLAMEHKWQKGATFIQIILHVLYRAFALLLMGVYQVNMDSYDKQNWFPRPLWAILATLSFFMIWLNYKPTVNKVIKTALIVAGYAMLVILALIYKGHPDEDGYTGMSVQWWGILGLIGWAYLVCTLVYLITKGNLKWMIAATIAVFIFNITAHTIWDGFKLLAIYDGSNACLIMAGVVVSMLYTRHADGANRFMAMGIIGGAVLIGAGLLIRPYSGGISKIYSTPAWVLICTGISILVYVLFIYMVDLKGRQNWFKIISAAGTATLTCYLIPYLTFFGMRLVHLNYPDSFYYGWVAIARSFAVAFLVIFIANWLYKKNLTLKL